ncbi:hypothetical protein [Flavobacterium selenitireducens]|uniref:hypothetical protein n=1 Tax=Flavobacterium selenitireducens TaxID=2722704 RepID=UPI00168BDEB6|nr:hypothetical protein [Flavobacterium selenitireducens]MBD3584037.1 hypothetical protein [Flavobacterium selenitireducens]
MRKLFPVLLLMFLHSAFGQNVASKKNLIEVLSIEKIWTSCNVESQFYKNDTINLYSSRAFEYCKKYISWEFFDSKSFKEIKGEDFGHYQVTDILTDNDFYNFEVKEIGNEVILEISTSKNKKKKFKIIETQFSKTQIQKIVIVRLL